MFKYRFTGELALERKIGQGFPRGETRPLVYGAIGSNLTGSNLTSYWRSRPHPLAPSPLVDEGDKLIIVLFDPPAGHVMGCPPLTTRTILFCPEQPRQVGI